MIGLQASAGDRLMVRRVGCSERKPSGISTTGPKQTFLRFASERFVNFVDGAGDGEGLGLNVKMERNR